MLPVYVTHQIKIVRDLSHDDKYPVPDGLWLSKDKNQLDEIISSFSKIMDTYGTEGHAYEFDEPRRIYVNEKMWDDLSKNLEGRTMYLFEFPVGFHKPLPQFVMLGGLALRHEYGGERWGDYGKYEEKSKYFRDAGCWWVEYEWRNGGLYSVNKDHDSLDGQLLTETTEAVWREDNAGYV